MLGAEGEFFLQSLQVTSHSKSPRTPGNEAGSSDLLKIYAWSNFLSRSHVHGAELRLGRRSCVVLVKGVRKTYLFRNIALKRIEKQCSASCYKVAWILTSDWIKLRANHAIHGSYVTCCVTEVVAKSRTRLSATTLRNLQKLDLLQDRFELGW